MAGSFEREKPNTDDMKTGNAVSRNMRIRLWSVAGILIAFFSVLIFMLYRYQIVDGKTNRAKAEAQQTADEIITPSRGNIYDKNMKLLAQSATVWTVVVSPFDMNTAKTDVNVVAQKLAELLEMDQQTIYDKLVAKRENGEYSVYQVIKRKIEKPVADAITQWIEEYNGQEENKPKKIKGITLVQDTKRYYPYNNFASTVIGYVNADGDGVNGIERYYNEVLKGTP